MLTYANKQAWKFAAAALRKLSTITACFSQSPPLLLAHLVLKVILSLDGCTQKLPSRV